MKITVESKEEHILINQLCDVALRADGVKNLAGVNRILSSIREGYNEHTGSGRDAKPQAKGKEQKSSKTN